MSKKQNILIIGATGFVGGRVLAELAQRDDVNISCMVRNGTIAPDAPDGVILTIIRGNLDSQEDVAKALAGKEGLIYVASLGFGHADALVRNCEIAGIKKAVFTSTTAIFTQLNAPSKVVRTVAEKIIMDSKLNWTIIRPTMICGHKGDRNMERLVKYLRHIPFVLVPGGGNALQQPIFVDDVARALVESYFSPKTTCKAYNVSGKSPLTFCQLVEIIGQAMGKHRFVIGLPLFPCRLLLRAYEKIVSNPILKEEQLLRLNENKDFDHNNASKDFDFAPIGFEEIAANLVSELNDK